MMIKGSRVFFAEVCNFRNFTCNTRLVVLVGRVYSPLLVIVLLIEIDKMIDDNVMMYLYIYNRTTKDDERTFFLPLSLFVSSRLVSLSLYVQSAKVTFEFKFLCVQHALSGFLSSTYPNIKPCPFFVSHPSSFSLSWLGSGPRLFASPGASIGSTLPCSSQISTTLNFPNASVSNEYVTAHPSLCGCLYLRGSARGRALSSPTAGNLRLPSPGASEGSTWCCC